MFEEETEKLPDNVAFLAQGTIYPDVIESGGSKAATIKSHHNVGGLPDNMKFTGLVEPLRGLFKDEVRALGRQLGLARSYVDRQPFPGPGLGVRIIGEITAEKIAILQKCRRYLPRGDLKSTESRQISISLSLPIRARSVLLAISAPTIIPLRSALFVLPTL